MLGKLLVRTITLIFGITLIISIGDIAHGWLLLLLWLIISCSRAAILNFETISNKIEGGKLLGNIILAFLFGFTTLDIKYELYKTSEYYRKIYYRNRVIGFIMGGILCILNIITYGLWFAIAKNNILNNYTIFIVTLVAFSCGISLIESIENKHLQNIKEDLTNNKILKFDRVHWLITTLIFLTILVIIKTIKTKFN